MPTRCLAATDEVPLTLIGAQVAQFIESFCETPRAQVATVRREEPD